MASSDVNNSIATAKESNKFDLSTKLVHIKHTIGLEHSPCSMKVDATTVDQVGATGIPGLSALSGLGGPAGNININMGDGASLQGLGMNGIDHNGQGNSLGQKRRSDNQGTYKKSKLFPGYTIYSGERG